MLTEADRTTLAEAGITNLDHLASAAAAFLRAHPVYAAAPVTNALSVAEEHYLRAPDCCTRRAGCRKGRR